jgi:TraB/PrgY/gumN family
LHSLVAGRALIVSICSTLALLATDRVAAQASGDRVTIEEITVIGRYPGPPLWKVTSGDRTLWIFGELLPVPKGLNWDPRNAERVLDRAGGVVGGPRVSAITLNPIRMFRLYLAVRRIVRLPEGTTLAEQVPPELYARYTTLRARHMPDNGEDDEVYRPAFAALRLYGAALDDVGLTVNSDVGKKIERRMRRSRAEEADVLVKTEPETVLEELAKITPEAELACFASIMTSIETDLEGTKERANAWATGDVEALKRFDYPDSQGSCIAMLLTAGGLADLRDALYATWLGEAEHALATYDTSFSVLPMRELVAADGLLAQLAARGYAVTAP